MRYMGLIAALTLAACQAPDGTTWANQNEANEHWKCVNEFGYRQGTPEYGQCRIQVAQLRMQEQANMQAGLATASILLAASQPPPPRPSIS